MKKKSICTTSSNGFSTPDNYFEKSKEDILKRLDIESLENKNEDLGFSIPEDYHANFKENIVKSIQPNVNKEVPIYGIRKKYFKYFIPVAASFLILFMISKNFDSAEKGTPIVNVIIDTIQEEKEQLPNRFSLIEENEDLLAIYMEDNYSDDLLDQYATEDLFFSN